MKILAWIPSFSVLVYAVGWFWDFWPGPIAFVAGSDGFMIGVLDVIVLLFAWGITTSLGTMVIRHPPADGQHGA